jgi:exodeoxyribonuclease V alpha subunit
MLSKINNLRDQNIFSDLDIQFLKFIISLSNDTNDGLLLGATLTSYFTSNGSSCVDLSQLAEQYFPLESVETERILCPNLVTWQQQLKNCSIVGQAGDYKPLIIDKQRLYLYRYWNYEQQLAANINSRRTMQRTDINHALLENGLLRLFSKASEEQKQAAQAAVLHNFCLISGAPGTGKTSTIVKILTLLLEQNSQLNIALAAPTGKATVRLQETIREILPDLACSSEIKDLIPKESYTIHRLLAKELTYDVIVIDEASMIDLALMAKMAPMISKSARWILLGDKDQLASVATGTVLADLCKTEDTVYLTKNYRFRENSGIWQLAQTIKQGEANKALELLDSKPDLKWYDLDSNLIEQISKDYSACFHEQVPAKILETYNKIGILCANRRGLYGMESINQRLEEEFRRKGLIQAGVKWYNARPIMITHNDYRLKLFNGDMGTILNNNAFFPDAKGEIRAFSPSCLPKHQTAYAMTIHKSQGSEFEQVIILLPDKLSPLLTRELLYTGISRARSHVSIWGNKEIFLEAISQMSCRFSGLGDLIH